MSKARILYVEDDAALSFMTKDHLERAGYDVIHAESGEQAWAEYKGQSVDICLVDVMLPELDGFSLVRRIREEDAATPILFLTAKSLKEDRLKGFKEGGDDYIIKPYSIEELVMKIEVFMRRKTIVSPSVAPGVIALGAYRFDQANRLLVHGDAERQLTQRENEVLGYLVRHPNQLIHRGDILVHVWGKDDYFLGRSLDVFISKLRKYLKADESIKIENIHGVGFKFTVPEGE